MQIQIKGRYDCLPPNLMALHDRRGQKTSTMGMLEHVHVCPNDFGQLGLIISCDDRLSVFM